MSQKGQPKPRTGVILRTGKPADFSRPELNELAKEIAAAAEGVSVGIVDTRASGPPPEEVLHIAIPLVEGYLGGKLLDAVLGWGKRRWRERRAKAQDDEIPHPIFIHFEGEITGWFRIGSPDGDPTSFEGRLGPRGERRSAPRWVAGPMAPPAPEDPDVAIVYPLVLPSGHAEALCAALRGESFKASLADPGDPGPEIRRQAEDLGPPFETIVRVLIADPEREPKALAALSAWRHTDAAITKPYWTSASVIDREGNVLRLLTLPPAPGASWPQPQLTPDRAVLTALDDLGLISPGDRDVSLWHATSRENADSIIAVERLRCDDNGVAYLSTSPEIAAMQRAMGAPAEALLLLEVLISRLEISKDWRPDEERVDLVLLCGQSAEHPIRVRECRFL
ncbi:MAG TPA: hypothetical protein VLC07_02340 [Solirubrobacterales bacterium]|nr:hypothetical protein [Solirubrobacterales bacterium]